jgi:hypothetical protein
MWCSRSLLADLADGRPLQASVIGMRASLASIVRPSLSRNMGMGVPRAVTGRCLDGSVPLAGRARKREIYVYRYLSSQSVLEHVPPRVALPFRARI